MRLLIFFYVIIIQTNCFLLKALWPLKTGQAANIEKVTILEKRMTENLNLLENIWLKDKPFLCGDEISVSDLVAACEVEQPSKIINIYYNSEIFMF